MVTARQVTGEDGKIIVDGFISLRVDRDVLDEKKKEYFINPDFLEDSFLGVILEDDKHGFLGNYILREHSIGLHQKIKIGTDGDFTIIVIGTKMFKQIKNKIYEHTVSTRKAKRK